MSSSSSCCQNAIVAKDLALTSLVVNGKASACKVCAKDAFFTNVTIEGDLTVNGGPAPDTNFSLPLSIPTVIARLVNGAVFNLGGSPVFLFSNPGDAIVFTNVYAPPVANLTYRLPMRDFGGINVVVDVSVNGSVTSTLLGAGITYIDVPLSGLSNPMTISITFASGTGPTGGFDGVIFAP